MSESTPKQLATRILVAKPEGSEHNFEKWMSDWVSDDPTERQERKLSDRALERVFIALKQIRDEDGPSDVSIKAMRSSEKVIGRYKNRLIYLADNARENAFEPNPIADGLVEMREGHYGQVAISLDRYARAAEPQERKRIMGDFAEANGLDSDVKFVTDTMEPLFAELRSSLGLPANKRGRF